MLAMERRAIAKTKHSIGHTAVLGLVVLLRVPGSPDLYRHDYKFTGNEATVETHWSESQALALHGLFKRLYATPDSSDDPNCYMLVDEVMAWPQGTAEHADSRGANPYRLKPGRPYGIRSEDGSLPHVMVGLDQPDLTLAIGGRKEQAFGGDLIVHHTDYAEDAYAGVTVELLPNLPTS
jgi:hypothetical protein